MMGTNHMDVSGTPVVSLASNNLSLFISISDTISLSDTLLLEEQVLMLVVYYPGS